MYSLDENKILPLTSNSAQEATRNMKKICPQPAQTKTKPKDMENPTTTTNNLSRKKLQRKPKTQDKTQTKKEVVAHGCPTTTTQKEKKIQQ
jgi:hypothetical protein